MEELSRADVRVARPVRARRVVAALLTAALLISGVGAWDAPANADTAPPTGIPATVSADPLPTVQQNGVVWSQVTVGNIVYATGSFTETWPAGQADQPGTNGQPGPNETPRTNLLAYNITTGALVTAFNPAALDAQGLGIAASPDGKTIYVVGDFTKVGTSTRNHIAAFDAGTGALVSGFLGNLSGEARAITVSSSAVYVGGDFNYSGSVARTHLAAFSPSTGALLSWAPTADNGQVRALALTSDSARVIVAGEFSTLDGQAASGMGSLDATSGALQPWAINTVIKDGVASTKCGITNLSVEGNNVYGGGFAYGCGNFEGTFAADATTGAVVWINDCHGDTYSTDPLGSVVYVASHSHDCTAIGDFPNTSPPGGAQRASAYSTAVSSGTNIGPDSYGYNYSGQPDSSLLTWFPTLAIGSVTGQNQAAWSVTGNADYVAYGGEFPTVNGTAQQGLVRFAVASKAPDKVGPVATSTITPTVSSTTYGQVDLSWAATWDRDNANLTYTILRDGTAVGTVSSASSFWQLPTLTYTDQGLAPDTSHTYRIRVTDPNGNSVGSGTSATVVVSHTGTPPPNAAPTASFTSSCRYLTCTFDATKSSDPDGTVKSYAWSFGDSTTGSGATASHTYKSGGSRTVTLTVTDNAGATSKAVSHTVKPVAPRTVVAQDTFAKNVRSGWGTSNVGGAWSRSGCKSQSVSGHRGNLVAARGQACSTWLPAVKRLNTDTNVTLRAPNVPKGGLQVAVLGRRISARDDIRLRLDLKPNGNVAVTLQSRIASKAAALSRTVTVTPASHPDGKIFVVLDVTGTASTLVQAKVWQHGDAEPTSWTVSGKTAASALQRDGGIGFAAFLAKAHNPKKAALRVTSLVTRLAG